jgi:hypothetical protein
MMKTTASLQLSEVVANESDDEDHTHQEEMPATPSGPLDSQAAVMEVLRDRFPKIAPDPIKCHLCQRVNGHKGKTDGCFGTLCSLRNSGSVNEHEYICHWCCPILAQLYNSSPVVKNFEEV